MINYINESLFRKDNIKKSWLIYIDGVPLTNADLYSESIELNESMCSEENLIFGNCPASNIKFTTSAIDVSFLNKEISVSVVLDEDIVNPFAIGTYIVTEETLSADKTRKEIVAYDLIYKLINKNVASWYDELTFPLTLKEFRDSLFSYMGIVQETTTLVNDSMGVEKTIDADTLSGADVIKAICEVNGAFGHINRDGEFVYLILDDTSVYNITSHMYSVCEYADYEVQTIDQLQIREESGDIGVIVGSGTNAYIIEDNFLLYGKSTGDLTSIANNILNTIDNISFVPCKINCIGNPCVEVGDFVTLTKANGDSFNTYVLNRSIKGLQFLTDEITANGDEVYPDDVNGISSDIIQLKGKSNVLERSIEQTRSTITDVAAGLRTEITQTAEGLQIQITDLQEQMDGETAYYERDTGTPTLLNYPYWDFTSAFKCDGTKKCDAIYNDNMTTGGDQYPHFYYSEQDRRDHRSDLCYVDDENLGYRFVLENDVWYWKEIADSDYTQILSRLSTLEATAEELKSEYQEISITVNNQGQTLNTHTSQISQTATQIQSLVSTTQSQGNRLTTAETKITQNANSITSLATTTSNLSGTVSTHTSQISQQATQIAAKVSQSGGSQSSFGWSLTSSAFDLYSGNSRVFRCNSNGVEVTGKITATSGKIGGWDIINGSIKNNNIQIQGDGNIICYKSGSTDYWWALNNNGSAVFRGNMEIAGYATTGSLNTVDAKINNLSAIAITTQNLSSQSINGGQITAGSISASKISSHSLTVNQLSINNNVFSLGDTFLGCGGLNCNGAINWYTGGRTWTLYVDATTGTVKAR